MQPDQPDNLEQKPEMVRSDVPTEMYAPPEDMGDEYDNSTKKLNNPQLDEDDFIHWSASEHISNDKNKLWFVGLAVVSLALIALDLFLLKSYTFSVLIIVMVVSIVVFYFRPSRIIDYTLSGQQGLYIGEKLFHFSEFKAFGLIIEDNRHSLVLIPFQRFAPAVSVYFPEEVGEQIVDIFGARLPMKDIKLEIIDIVIRKLRL